MGEASDGNQREFIMAMLLRPEQPVEQKSREAKNAKDLIRYISGLMSMIEIHKVNGIVYFLSFQSKIVYVLFITWKVIEHVFWADSPKNTRISDS